MAAEAGFSRLLLFLKNIQNIKIVLYNMNGTFLLIIDKRGVGENETGRFNRS
jgi:hypothetical protein